MKRYIGCLLLMLLFFSTLMGCKKEEASEEEDGYKIYYINKEETAVVTEAYEPNGDSSEKLLSEFLHMLQTTPEDTQKKAAIPSDVEVVDYNLENGQLSLNFGASYLEMDKLYEILCRSAVVRTLCQVPGVEYVSILLCGEPRK